MIRKLACCRKAALVTKLGPLEPNTSQVSLCQGYVRRALGFHLPRGRLRGAA